ncbi:hypothetical protein SAMN05421637_2375 [Demequina mangrovi]|uniref:Uncharacterized protein n=1 Tax=Demequina mangrovi TaxID=1043493 RepID=A0A1H7A5U2_9MICO|nr:hypothetical protein SAMN05421637_2375 [Demequina mangrovi]
MGKWTKIKDSLTVRVVASAGTIVAVATVAGAGVKWN